MQHIKPIETRYAGCRFRSRLEARWAVFFDALEIDWEYEPEGFETSAGRYLPDFRIKLLGDLFASSSTWMWFEVKPEGAPDDPRHTAFAADNLLTIARGMPRDSAAQRQHLIVIRHVGPSGFVGAPPGAFGAYRELSGAVIAFLEWGTDTRSRLVDRAYAVARSARFEYGENATRAKGVLSHSHGDLKQLAREWTLAVFRIREIEWAGPSVTSDVLLCSGPQAGIVYRGQRLIADGVVRYLGRSQAGKDVAGRLGLTTQDAEGDDSTELEPCTSDELAAIHEVYRAGRGFESGR